MNKSREITDINLSRRYLAAALQLDQHRSRPYPEHAAALELRNSDDEIESLYKRVAELEALAQPAKPESLTAQIQESKALLERLRATPYGTQNHIDATAAAGCIEWQALQIQGLTKLLTPPTASENAAPQTPGAHTELYRRALLNIYGDTWREEMSLALREEMSLALKPTK